MLVVLWTQRRGDDPKVDRRSDIPSGAVWTRLSWTAVRHRLGEHPPIRLVLVILGDDKHLRRLR